MDALTALPEVTCLPCNKYKTANMAKMAARAAICYPKWLKYLKGNMKHDKKRGFYK